MPSKLYDMKKFKLKFTESITDLHCGQHAYVNVESMSPLLEFIELSEGLSVGYGLVGGVMCGLMRNLKGDSVLVTPICSADKFSIEKGDEVEIITNDLKYAIIVSRKLTAKNEEQNTKK